MSRLTADKAKIDVRHMYANLRLHSDQQEGAEALMEFSEKRKRLLVLGIALLILMVYFVPLGRHGAA
jgi:hypothetical protein